MPLPRREKIGGIERGSKGEGVGWRFDSKNEMAQAYASRQAARYVTKVSAETRSQLQGIISKSVREGISARNTAKLIKSSVGLNGPQGAAVNNYYNNLLARGTDPGRAWALSDKYSEKLLKSRAKTIARTEIMGALNGGALEQARQRRDAGLYLNPHKKWIITADEVTCHICRPLEGKVRKLEETFPTGVLAPPTHPNCRCSLSFSDPIDVGDSQAENDLAELRRLRAQTAEAHMFDNAEGFAQVTRPNGQTHQMSLADAINDPQSNTIRYRGFITANGQRVTLAVQLENQRDQAESFGAALGRRVTVAEKIKATGFYVPKGATEMTLSAPDGESMKLKVKGLRGLEDSIHMQRFWYTTKTGKLFQENSYMGVQGSFARKGYGREVMRRSVLGASELGIQEFHTLAEGNLHDASKGTWNGYYTWPRLGFDGKLKLDSLRSTLGTRVVLHEAMQNEIITKTEFDKYVKWDDDGKGSRLYVQQKINEELVAAGFDPTKEINISELMKSRTGRSLWKVYGHSLNLKFSLAPGSRSRMGLDAYLASKK